MYFLMNTPYFKVMEINNDINILREVSGRLQGGCNNIPGTLNAMLASEARPLQELKRRLDAANAAKNAAESRARSLEYQINQIRSVHNETEERNVSWMVAEYNKEKANIRSSECEINALRQQISEIQNSFYNLRHYINIFQNSDMNSLLSAKSGVDSLIHVMEEYLNTI